MNCASTPEPASDRHQQERFSFCLMSFVVIAAMLLAVSLLSSPIPGVNEPHYLCKARSFADANWCPRDFFLVSSNAHYCFFWLVGPLTKVASLNTVALIGRSVTAVLLALGWSVLGRSLGLSPLSRILAAAAFAFLSQLGSFAGEWLLGGFESKVAAWGLGLIAIGYWVRGTVQVCPGWMTLAGVFCGISAMVHPVVGGWIAVCICMAWLMDQVAKCRLGSSQNLVKSMTGIAVFVFTVVVVSLPGLIPAIRLVLDDSLPKSDRELATFIQVYWRLKHHLDPTELQLSQWLYAGGLLVTSVVAFVLVRRRNKTLHSQQTAESIGPSSEIIEGPSLLIKLLTASTIIAIVGIVIGWHTVPAQEMPGWEWRAIPLKFYPFRTLDALLPIVAGLFVAILIQQLLTNRSVRFMTALVALCCGLPLILASSLRETTPPGYTQDQYTDWQAACAWIRNETPRDALFLTPRESFAFKWMAERAEYVCYKDCPQDAAGILEWNRRLWWLHDWTLQSSTDGVYQNVDLEKLRAETGCDYIITRILGPFKTKPLWQGRVWQIIRIPDADAKA